ncbi:GTP cyclohydrolase [Cohnella sp. CFH 77786]|uniref:YciI family protein n=1 Tax=Cohnella sp. CFH 77786 TaxID=2662265 RepID=UPI001C60D139|nr:YciI family protein [Cohnella sp. CFH 77786]MBW5445391.1 GTP cyclohydrolase [Cohnella sp. CFH 77786]
MFLILLKYKASLDAVERYLPEHKAFLETYYGQGLFLLSGRKVPRNGGVILAAGSDRELVEETVRQDPFYKHEIADYEIVEFEPTGWDERLNSVFAPHS